MNRTPSRLYRGINCYPVSIRPGNKGNTSWWSGLQESGKQHSSAVFYLFVGLWLYSLPKSTIERSNRISKGLPASNSGRLEATRTGYYSGLSLAKLFVKPTLDRERYSKPLWTQSSSIEAGLLFLTNSITSVLVWGWNLKTLCSNIRDVVRSSHVSTVRRDLQTFLSSPTQVLRISSYGRIRNLRTLKDSGS